jgi:hypothetical protein
MQRPLAWVPYASAVPVVLFVGIIVLFRESSVYVPLLVGFAIWTCLYALAMELDIIRGEVDAESEARALHALTIDDLTERLASSDAILGQ